jgi:nucleoid-associated protein YgaU
MTKKRIAHKESAVTGNLSALKWIAIGCVAAAAGCQGNGGSKTAESGSIRSDVADIRPIESTTPVYQPAPVQPVISDTPLATASSSTGNTHVVKHGETLYGIAKQSYGDGKQWQRIASANPGVSPTSLKVGQTLVIP